MAGRLVTIATFDEATKAHLAKNLLERAGIRAALTDEETVSNVWYLSTALGGIKVKVLEEDAERAVAVLEEAIGSAEESVDEEELAAQAEAEAPEDPDDAAGVIPPPASDPVADLAAREKEARFALFAVFFGFLIPLGHLFAIVMILQACTGPGTLSRRGRYHIYAAILILAFIYLPLVILVMFLVGS